MLKMICVPFCNALNLKGATAKWWKMRFSDFLPKDEKIRVDIVVHHGS